VTDLVQLGLRPGMKVRFRRDPHDRWKIARVDGVEKDGSLALRDEKGAARAIPVELVEVATRGPRGAHTWERVLDRAAREEQLQLF
jgi:hypothetical protein